MNMTKGCEMPPPGYKAPPAPPGLEKQPMPSKPKPEFCLHNFLQLQSRDEVGVWPSHEGLRLASVESSTRPAFQPAEPSRTQAIKQSKVWKS